LRNDDRHLFFGTSNRSKFDEARRILAPFKIDLCFLGEKGVEIQSEDIEEISKHAAKSLVQRSKVPVIVEDAGLFIDELQGFPGPYSAYVYETLGSEGILRLMQGASNRSAAFLSVVAFCGPNVEVRSFSGRVNGRIAQQCAGSRGFGFDPIFVPDKGDGRTFAEMNTEEKNRLSHRSRSFIRFAEWWLSIL